MGKNKIPLKAIEKRRDMQMTFYKRKRGIIKKAIELSILCETRILLTMYDNLSGSLITYCSHQKQSLKQLFKTAPQELQYNITNQDYKKMGVEDEIDAQQQKCQDAFQGLGLKKKKLSKAKQKRKEMKKNQKVDIKKEQSVVKAERKSEIIKDELDAQQKYICQSINKPSSQSVRNQSSVEEQLDSLNQRKKKNKRCSSFDTVIKLEAQEKKQEQDESQFEDQNLQNYESNPKQKQQWQQQCQSPQQNCIKSTQPSPVLPQSHIHLKDFQYAKKWQEQANKKLQLAKKKIKSNLQLGNINLPLQNKQPFQNHTPNTNPMKSSFQNIFGCLNPAPTIVHTPDPAKMMYPNTSGLSHQQLLSPFL